MTKNFTSNNLFVQHGPAGLVDGQGLRPGQPRWEGDERGVLAGGRLPDGGPAGSIHSTEHLLLVEIKRCAGKGN